MPPIQLVVPARVLSPLQPLRKRWLAPLLVAAMVWAPLAAGAQAQPATPPDPAQESPSAASASTAQPAVDCSADPDEPSCPTPLSRSLKAIEAYVTAPARWDGRDWLAFGGSLAAIGVAHHFDTSVRDHFAGTAPTSVSNGSPDTLQDALPAAALFLGTWGYANLTDDDDGRHEAHTMLEAGVFSVATAYAVGYLARREGPNQTSNPNRWESSGTSFPSEHATVAFAIGTVLAESGNDHYRWVRRVLGYGVAGFTAYQRLNHNAHWLSDTVAGAALGAASAHFAMNRRQAAQSQGTLALEPISRGVMIRYSAQLP
ncbi:MAG TPA: phosphatase PAP2 family protein [Steroidobacteraceae bacterium]|nr:phosphatase PAP2 family protein [Steroidobacteraceae bacterium]